MEDKPVMTLNGETIIGEGSYKLTTMTEEYIENFIEEAGADHLPTFGGKYEGGIQAQQVPDELAPCIKAIMDSGEQVENYLEIGVAAGGTLFLFEYFLKPLVLVLIDDNRHPKAHIRPYILRDIRYREIIGDSKAEGTINALAEMNLTFDLIIIDGDHSFAGVSADVSNYLPFLREGGFMILHDSAQPEWGVYRLVKEMRTNPFGLDFVAEFITKKHSRPCGLALFRKVVNEDK